MKRINIKLLRNFLIVAGFYGIYYAVFQFISLLWRNIFVLDHIFSGVSGEFFMWILWDFPTWLFCVLSGYFIPFVIDSKRKISWALALGGIFALNDLLFMGIHHATAPPIFYTSTRYLSIIMPLVLCPAGSLLQERMKNREPEPGS
jgi:hypothetical protein